jgi:predicted nucleic acid-binding protein
MGQAVTIFLDANVIIYQVEGVEPFQKRVHSILQELVQQQADASFAVSRLSMMECLVKPVREGDTASIDRFRSFFAASDLAIVDVSAQVLETAIMLRAHYKLRTPDAIQAASALSVKSDIFVTGDKAFQKVRGLHVRLIE